MWRQPPAPSFRGELRGSDACWSHVIKLGLSLILAALAVPAPTYGQFLPGSHDQQALREVSLELAPARGDSRIVAQAGATAPETAEKATSPPAPGGYTPEQIAEMINNPLGYLWLLNVQSTITWFSGALALGDARLRCRPREY